MRLPTGASSLAFGATRRPPAGIALIIVLIAIFVLTMLAGGFALSMKVETRLAQNGNSETQLEWLGRSGVEYACWMLAQEKSIPQEPYDALNQVWAGGPGGLGTSNTVLVNVEKEVRLGEGSFTWEIVDHERKVNINTASEAMLQQALNLMGVGAGDITPIVSSIEDWIDPDDTTHMQGAESDYYQSLDPPYRAKNGPIDDISELLLVKGITPDIYWGPDSTNHVASALQGRQLSSGFSQLDQPQVTFSSGLVDLFTPLSSGRINVNTASADVLQLLPGVDSNLAEAIVAAREGDDDGSGLVGPYRNVQDIFTRVPQMNRGLFNQLMQYCAVRSSVYDVHINAEFGGYKRRFNATVVVLNPHDVRMLTFSWE